MKGFLTTHNGMEGIAALEVEELIGSESKIDESCVVFGIKNYEDLFVLCYKSQSAIGVCCLLSEFDYKDIFDDFEKNIEKIKFDEWLGKNAQFRVRCIKNYEDDAASAETESRLGEIIISHMQKKYGYKQKVDLEKPEIVVFFFLTAKRCYAGIDFAGFDLSKRPYKIFQHPADIKGTIAYSLIRIAGYSKNEALLDVFSGSGTIPIEAALFSSNFPVRHFDKEKFIFLKFKKFKDFDFDKLFSRMDAEWLDTKFEKGKIGKIVTKMPNIHGNELYNEFFYQAEFVLNEKGKIVLIGNKELVEKYSSKYKFKISDKRNVFSGKHEYEVFI